MMISPHIMLWERHISEGDGEKPNLSFDPSFHDGSQASLILGISGFFAGFACLIILMRCYVQLFIRRHFEVDDYLMVLATACSFIVLGSLITELRNGLDEYTETLAIHDLQNLSKIGYVHSIFLTIGIAVMKLGSGFLLLRISQTTKSLWFVKFLMVFMTAQGMAQTGVYIFRCIPVQSIWVYSLRDNATCMSRNAVIAVRVTSSVLDAMTNAILTSVPFYTFPRRGVSRRCRAVFVIAITLGYLGCFAAVVRTGHSIFAMKQIVAYRGDVYLLWTNIELNVGIVACSIPALGPILQIFTHSGLGRRKTRSDSISISDTPLAGRHNKSRIKMTSISQYQSNQLPADDDFCCNNSKSRSRASPACEYKVEVSASKLSAPYYPRPGSDRRWRNKSSGSAVVGDQPGITRTTDVYVQMDKTGNGCAGKDDK